MKERPNCHVHSLELDRNSRMRVLADIQLTTAQARVLKSSRGSHD